MKDTFFTVFATGRTNPIKDELQSWGFFWSCKEQAWAGLNTCQFIIQLYMQKISSGQWPGITLNCVEE